MSGGGSDDNGGDGDLPPYDEPGPIVSRRGLLPADPVRHSRLEQRRARSTRHLLEEPGERLRHHQPLSAGRHQERRVPGTERSVVRSQHHLAIIHSRRRSDFTRAAAASDFVR